MRHLVPLVLLLPGIAQAQETRVAPYLTNDFEVRLYGVSNYRAPAPAGRYRNLFVKAELETTLHLTEGLSVQALVKFEPLADGPVPGDHAVDRAFQDQGAYIQDLFAAWQATGWLTLQAGKFTAPFGYGYDAFPGIRLRDVAENYEVTESLGFGATFMLVQDEGGWGEHGISVAAFMLDTTSLSSSYITRKRFGRDEADRYSRNSRGQGGPGNTDSLNNYAIALNGEGMSALPGFAYHIGLISRAPGVDGTAREWGVAIGAQQTIRWSEDLSTQIFAEVVRLGSAGGRPVVVVDGADTILAERRTVTTLGAQTSWGQWRATLGWQTYARRNNVEAVPRESYLEASVGRELGLGFGVDIGWSRSRLAQDGGGRGTTDAALALLGWKAAF